MHFRDWTPNQPTSFLITSIVLPGKCSRTPLADDFDYHALVASSFKFAVENLLPCPKIKFAVCNRHNNLAPHDLTFRMGIGVIFAGAFVSVTFGTRIEGRESFEPAFVVNVQARSWLLIKTEAVMCIAFAKHKPSRTSLRATSRSTSGVILKMCSGTRTVRVSREISFRRFTPTANVGKKALQS